METLVLPRRSAPIERRSVAELQTGCAQHFTEVAFESDTDESRLMMRRCSVIFDDCNPAAQV